MEEMNWFSESIQHYARRALENELSWSEGYGRIQRFFEKVRQSGYRIILILDEFDHARNLFKGNISGFQGLRELSYRPEWRVTFITTSRRSIREIEIQTGIISTFDGIFHKHYLAMFNEDDLEDYFLRFSSIGASITSTDKEQISFYCGGHPFLLEMLGYEIVEIFREEQRIDVEKAAYRGSQAFIDQYDRMVDLLREDKSLNKLLQILFGPVVDVKQTHIDEFLKYGLIRPSQQGTYLGFSEHFQDFISLTERQSLDVDLWPIWHDTEKIIRHLVTSTMLKIYGENWIFRLERTYNNIQSIFDKCRQAHEKEKKSFGSRASQNLIDFTYPYDLFTIIFAEWNAFKPILGKDKNYWEQRAQLLAKIRTPLAHNRDESLYDYERQIAEGYCNEILTIISHHK